MFVVDASVVASWAFPDQDESAAQTAFGRLASETAVSPALFWFELRNVLLCGERRGRITPAQTSRFLKHIAVLPIETDHEPDESSVLALARMHKLTVYDTSYLELAQRRNLPLATLDGALAKAAKAADVPLIG